MDATPSPPPRPPCLGEASEGGSEGMALPDPMINLQDLTHSTRKRGGQGLPTKGEGAGLQGEYDHADFAFQDLIDDQPGDDIEDHRRRRYLPSRETHLE